jgi:hypothetical protein
MTMTLEIRPKNSQGAITTSLLLRELSVSEGEKTTYPSSCFSTDANSIGSRPLAIEQHSDVYCAWLILNGGPARGRPGS